MVRSSMINKLFAYAFGILLLAGSASACSTPVPISTAQPTPTSLLKDNAASGPSNPNQANSNSGVLVALIGFAAGSFASLLGVLSKYLLDYRLERRKLELNERQDISTIIGSSQSNLLRVTRDLFRWLSSFFDDPAKARQWLEPGPTADKDSYSLQEFCYLLFRFMTWGRITQDAINSLPTAVTSERPDLQRAYVFVDLALDLLAYGGLFKEVKDYDSEQNMRLSMQQIDRITEVGIRIWKEENQNISRAAFNQLYYSIESPLSELRQFLIVLYRNQEPSAHFILARLAALRAVSAGFLLQYSWTIDLPRKRIILKHLRQDLQFASLYSAVNLPFSDVLLQNMSRLMKRYRCELFRVPMPWTRRLAG